jgi:hypothetical protein
VLAVSFGAHGALVGVARLVARRFPDVPQIGITALAIALRAGAPMMWLDARPPTIAARSTPPRVAAALDVLLARNAARGHASTSVEASIPPLAARSPRNRR